jgi:hypothetical protein
MAHSLDNRFASGAAECAQTIGDEPFIPARPLSPPRRVREFAETTMARAIAVFSFGFPV